MHIFIQQYHTIPYHTNRIDNYELALLFEDCAFNNATTIAKQHYILLHYTKPYYRQSKSSDQLPTIDHWPLIFKPNQGKLRNLTWSRCFISFDNIFIFFLILSHHLVAFMHPWNGPIETLRRSACQPRQHHLQLQLIPKPWMKTSCSREFGCCGISLWFSANTVSNLL